jgi:GDP-4-dehydro-6-deoxy-D-mannose reductase
LPARILITGGAGFVGRYLSKALGELPDAPDVVVTGRSIETVSHVRTIELDVTSADAVRRAIETVRPTHIFHLAAITDASRTWEVNVGGTLNVALAAREFVPECRVVFCSTGLVYGSGARNQAPFDEAAMLNPKGVYARSKAAADLLLGQLATAGLRVIRVRPFNHTGVGQSTDFAVPSFATKLARIARGDAEPIVRVGSLSGVRDFLDVRDVVRVYIQIYRCYDTLGNGSVFNVASGQGVAMREVLDRLLSFVPRKVEVIEQADAADITAVVGDPAAAMRLGWAPSIPLSDTLRWVYDDALRRDH